MELRRTLSLLAEEAAHAETEADILRALVPARYVLEKDQVYLEKVLDGKVVERWRIGSYRWWQRVQKYSSRWISRPSNPLPSKGCPASCGLCELHKNRTALVNVVVTNRCNSCCPYCFFYSFRAGYVYEPSIPEIVEMLKFAASQNDGKLLAVQLTGGEPLLRQDLPELVQTVKQLQVQHVQLNTNGLSLGLLYLRSEQAAVELARRLRAAGVNTVYLSFDGVQPEINKKNHWLVPFALEAMKQGKLTSIVLVPTLIRGWNFPGELGPIVEFAALHPELVRGVNFQPVSFVGCMQPNEEQRVTISDVLEEFERLGKLALPLECWYPVPALVPFLVALGKAHLGFYNSPVCGVATYVFVERENGKVVRLHPITEFVDVDGLYQTFLKLAERKMRHGLLYSWLARCLTPLGKLLSKKLLEKYLLARELPDGTKLAELLAKIISRKDYSSAGEFHYKFLFLGMMHFQDLFNYDIDRVMRCSIHYAAPGKLIPFCTYNVLPKIYRDKILRENAIKDARVVEKLQEQAKQEFLEIEEIRSNQEKQAELRKHPVYRQYYGQLL